MEMVEILHRGKGGDVEQVARTSKQISRVYICLSLLFMSYFVIIAHSYLLDIIYVLTLVLIQ